jgi:dihydrofolate reductase
MRWKRRDGVMNAGARRVQRVYLVLLLDKSLLREGFSKVRRGNGPGVMPARAQMMFQHGHAGFSVAEWWMGGTSVILRIAAAPRVNITRGHMRRIIVGAQVSIDGVMQAPGGRREDPTKGFKFGGWVMPYFDQEFGEEIDRLFSEKFDLLLGRKTYEIFAAYWPYYDEDAPHGGIAKLFKEIKKYAVSRSGGVDTGWQGSVLLRDIADVKRLRDEDGPNLVTQGSTELVHALLANDLVDAITIFTVPVVLGAGKKLFADGSAPHAYKLIRSRVSSAGLMIGHYERDGDIKIGGTALDSSSEREIARQERMKREG